MRKFEKTKTVERVLFVALLGALAAGGFCYEWFRSDMSRWQLVVLIVAGYVVAFGIYRQALRLVLRKLDC